MSFNYTLSSSYGPGDDVMFSPGMDDVMLDDRLEQARLNRTNYYRRMLANRSRPADDYLVSKKITYNTTSGGPAREASISDTSGTCSIPKIPEPHSSWRFYTSYDNGEWKRHAVPVDHDEEEILREPTKTLRRERDMVSPPVESSLRRMRQAGGPLVACLQPRPKRTSESSNDGRNMVSSRMVNGQLVNGLDGQVVGQLGPTELMNLHGNEDLVRQILEGQLMAFDGENQPQGNVKQEYTSKYVSTVTETHPAGRLKSPGMGVVERAGGPGGGLPDAAKQDPEETGVRKSRRPRIYGFQEKIIIPTKYKTTEEKAESGAAGQSTSVNQSTLEVNQGERKDNITSTSVADKSPFKIVNSSIGSNVVDEKSSRTSQRRVPCSPESQTVKVKVMVVNSGSDGEGDRKSEEDIDRQKKESEVAQKESGKTEAFFQSPFVMKEGMSPMENFQAFQENFRRQFESAGMAKSPGSEQEKTGSNSGQRVFSKDEQTFCEVGPDGAKRDGKVLQTYEVRTMTNGEGAPGAPGADDRQTFIKEIPITPVGAVRSSTKMAAISFPAELRRSNNDFVEIVRDPLRTQKTVEMIREGVGVGDSPSSSRRIVGRDSRVSSFSPKTVERRAVGTFDDFRSPRSDDKKTTTTNVFDQTGSLFKQLSPRPRSEREKDSESATLRDTRQWSRDQGSPIIGGYTTRTSRTWTHDDGLHRGARSTVDRPQTSRRKVVIVRETDTSDDQTQSTSGLDDSVQEDNAGERTVHGQKKVEIVRECGSSKEENHSDAEKTVRIVRELDGTANQPSSQRKVEIVREMKTPTGDSADFDRTVKTLWGTGSDVSSQEGHTSVGGRVLFASVRRDNQGSVGNGEDSVSKSESIRKTDDSQRRKSEEKTTALDSQWEVQMAVKD